MTMPDNFSYMQISGEWKVQKQYNKKWAVNKEMVVIYLARIGLLSFIYFAFYVNWDRSLAEVSTEPWEPRPTWCKKAEDQSTLRWNCRTLGYTIKHAVGLI